MQEAEGYAEVYSVVEGAEDRTYAVSNEEADDKARELADDLRSVAKVEGFREWEVYILPHYHPADFDGECVCVQWLTDHHPAYSSSPDES